MSDVKDRWAEFLNPDVVRTKLVAMGLFMVAHEMHLKVIKDHPLDFFCHEWTADGGPQQSEEYRREILARDPKGKRDALRGSIAWLREREIIDDADLASIREFSNARNLIAHELLMIIGGSKMPDFVGLFPRLIELTAKIERWWVVNVEIATDPDLAGKEIDEDGITPWSLWVMQMLGRVALGENEEAWEFYRKFVESEPPA